jgi:hypothetical protein
MSLSLHTIKTYKVEYGENAINGWEETTEFVDFIMKIQGDEEYEGSEEIFVSEDETNIEIPFIVLEQLKSHPKWGKVVEKIIENSDKSNDYAVLNVW